ncbi:hypothetical protein [Xanthovirga aplysinae]|uniref:hypothetical protein n=1 Tax=Xanthovirga aplysinae TaxID=2529853 RepID=UPI0016572ACC|nr:hypothetical protein [Xanthovirga aplysinae]
MKFRWEHILKPPFLLGCIHLLPFIFISKVTLHAGLLSDNSGDILSEWENEIIENTGGLSSVKTTGWLKHTDSLSEANSKARNKANLLIEEGREQLKARDINEAQVLF